MQIGKVNALINKWPADQIYKDAVLIMISKYVKTKVEDDPELLELVDQTQILQFIGSILNDPETS